MPLFVFLARCDRRFLSYHDNIAPSTLQHCALPTPPACEAPSDRSTDPVTQILASGFPRFSSVDMSGPLCRDQKRRLIPGV